MRFLVALCLLIVFSGPARALDGLVECPDGNEALARVTETTYGVPLSETYAMEVAGRSLEVPIGYLSPRPPPKFYRNQPFRSSKGFQFSFWMPDGRMPEIDTYFNVMNRPCEAGRAQAGEATYLVDVTLTPLIGASPSERRRFDDDRVRIGMKERFDPESGAQITRRGDMIEYRPRNHQGYWILSAPDASFDAVVRCIKKEISKLPNAACLSDIRFHEDDYSMNVFMPRDSVQDFESAAKLARRLIGEWRQGAVAE